MEREASIFAEAAVSTKAQKPQGEWCWETRSPDGSARGRWSSGSTLRGLDFIPSAEKAREWHSELLVLCIKEMTPHIKISLGIIFYTVPPHLVAIKKKIKLGDSWNISIYIALSTYYICIYRYGEIWIYLYPHNNQHRSNSNIRKWRGAALNTNEICIKYSF